MPEILLIEDDRHIGERVQAELVRAGYACRWKDDGVSGLQAFERQAPDLLLLDLNLPGRTGFEVLRHVRTCGEVPVIVLTARVLGEDKVRALDLGADDYVTKPFWTDELLARIRAVLRRRGAAPQRNRTERFAGLVFDLDALRLFADDGEIHLTPTELAVLRYLLERPGRAIRREQLSEAVLPDEDANLQALQNHVSRLRKKLGDAGGCIATVWGIGYRFVPEPA